MLLQLVFTLPLHILQTPYIYASPGSAMIPQRRNVLSALGLKRL